MKSNLEVKEWFSIIESSLTVDDIIKSCQSALKAHPESAELWNIYGEIMEELDYSREAELAFQKSVSIEPGNASVWNRLGLLLRKKGLTAKSEIAFLKAVLVDSQFPNLRHDSRSRIDRNTKSQHLHEDSGKDGLSKNNVDQLMSFDTSVWLSVVDEFLQEGEQQRACRILEKAFRLHPSDQLICLKYASMLEEYRRYPEAALILNRLVEFHPDDAEAWHRLALIGFVEGNEEAAVAASRRAVALASANQYKNRLALLLDHQGKTNEAIEILSQALNSDSATLNLLGVMQHKIGRREDARISYEEALRVGGEDSFIHNNLGRLLEDIGDEEGAALAFDKSVELNKSNAVAWNNFGVALRRQEFFLEAETAFRLSISIAPYFKNPWLNLRDLSFTVPAVSATVTTDSRFDEPAPSKWMEFGWNVFDETHHALQLKRLTSQIEQHPENPRTHYQLALCMFDARLYQDAGTLIRKAIALHEWNASYWNLLGNICEELCNPSESIDCYKRAIDCDNDYKAAIFNLKETQVLYNEEEHWHASILEIAS